MISIRGSINKQIYWDLIIIDSRNSAPQSRSSVASKTSKHQYRDLHIFKIYIFLKHPDKMFKGNLEAFWM